MHCPVIVAPDAGVTTEGYLVGATQTLMFPAPIEIPSGTRVSVRVRSSSTTIQPENIKLIYVKKSELVGR